MLLMTIGIVLGVIIGVLPGLGGANGVAILLPLTFAMPPTSAIIMLSCIYWGALFGGAITSILFNIPGEPWSVATTFDGYPMAQQGRAGEALTAAFTSSFVGAFVAVVMITFLAPMVAKFALQFGPPEFFAVYLLTFCSFIGMGKGSPWKTLSAMMLGFALAAVGMDTVTGQLRLIFGFTDLDARLRFPDRRHRTVRHRRDPAVDGRGTVVHRQDGQDQSEGRLPDLGQPAQVLGHVAPQQPHRHLDGHHARRRHAGVVHELWRRQADVARRREIRHRPDRGRDRAGDRGARRRNVRVAAHAGARHSGLAHCRGPAGRPADLGPAAGAALVRRAEGLRLGADREHVPGQHLRPRHRAHVRAAVRRDPAHPVLDHRARSSS